MRAVGYFIVIEPLPESVKKTDGGLLLTDAHTDDIRYIKGKVITTGTLVEGVSDGDTVLYSRNSGDGIELNGKYFKVIQERDIAIVL